MKKTLIALAGLLPVMAMAQKDRAFTIMADFGNGLNSKVIFNRYTLSTGQHQDTAEMSNGKVSFKGAVGNERQFAQIGAYSRERGSGKSVLFYLEPGVITINYPADAKPWHYTLGGTPLNKQYSEYNSMLNGMVDSVNGAQPGDKPIDRFNPQVRQLKLAVIERFIAKYPSSPIGLDQLTEYAIGNKAPDAIEPIFNRLTAAQRNSAKGLELAERIKGMKMADIGDMAPAFTLPDTKGTAVSLSDLKGKYVLIDFWATWCGPCMAEMPNVKTAYRKYSNNNFEIVGISLDRPDSKQKWMDVIQRDSLSWIQVSDLKWWNSTAALLYNVNSVPANFLVDPNGRIIAKNLRGEALQTKLSALLAPVSAQAGKFVIDGKINSDTACTGKIYLGYNDNGEEIRDSSVFVNNTYHFQGTMKDGAIEANLTWEDRAKGIRNKGFLQFYVVPDRVTVVSNGQLHKAEITGSPIQQDAEMMEKQRRGSKRSEKERLVDYIKSHPDSWLSYVYLSNYFIRTYEISLGEADSLYAGFSPALKKYPAVDGFKKLLDGRRAAVVGKPAIEFTEKDIDGRVVALSSYRGKYVLIDFWASWCHPCRAENPNVTAAYYKYKDKGLNILSVSLDGGREAWLKAVKQDKLEWTQVSNLKAFDDDVVVKYGIHSIPRNFLIDPAGKIVAMDLRGPELEQQLAEIFK